MSIWYEVTDENDVELSDDGKSVEILFSSDFNGNSYVDVPVEILKKILIEAEERVGINK